ncbi:MAG: spherulation-specific family 4 protein [Nitrososphaera sp.]|nr:spherulation-specific family 4 protein [Nitrososphaera sp.]
MFILLRYEVSFNQRFHILKKLPKMINQVACGPSGMQFDNHERALLLLVTAGAAAMMTLGSSVNVAVASSTEEILESEGGLVIPIYGWKNDWEEIVQVKSEHAEVEIIVAINPSNGVGNGRDAHWRDVIGVLQEGDVNVVGYISTGYGSRSEDEVKQEVKNYYKWYEDIDGVFLDEQSANVDLVGYYEEIYEYAKELDEGKIIVANPGAPVPEEFVDTADLIMVYENAGIPDDVSQDWMEDYDKNHFGAIPYGENADESSYKKLHEQVGFVYVAPDASWMSLKNDSIRNQVHWADD